MNPKELTEQQKKELDHQIECQRKAILPNLNGKKEIEKAVKRVLKEYKPVFELLAEDWDSPLELSEEAQDILIKTGDISEEEAKEIKKLRESIKEAEQGKTKPLSQLDE